MTEVCIVFIPLQIHFLSDGSYIMYEIMLILYFTVPRGGSNFDGWSFFGGILLTVGIAAIAFISFKYYKVRAGQHNTGANYNRF